MTTARPRNPRFYLRYLMLGIRLSQFGVGLGGRVKVAFTSVAIAFRRPGFDRVDALVIPISYGGIIWEVKITDRSQLEAMREVLLDCEYDLDLTTQPLRILDIGGNVGFATIGFRSQFPAAEIAAVEADPQTFALLDSNVGADPQVTTLHRAVMGKDGEASFAPALQSASSSVGEETSAGSVVVRASTINTILDELGWESADLVKIDIEGAEFAALQVPGVLDRVGAIVGEFHYDLAPAGAPEINALLPGFRVKPRELDRPGRLLVVADSMNVQ